MLFSSLIFIYAFLPIVFILYYLSPKVLKNIVLLVASLAFYAFGEPTFVLVMIASILLNYIFGLLVHKFKHNALSKVFLAMSVLVNMGLLFVFKYLSYVSTLLNRILPIEVIHIVLPIGISFFTFQAMSYVIDVYRGDAQVQKNPLNLGLFISFFPQLIAGPIVRYNTIAREIDSRNHSIDMIANGFKRFLLGLFKKVLLANNLAVIADYSFGYTAEISTLTAWLGLIAYALQIFYDFSGYSDMAIGLAEMFGFHLQENFNYPYISKSISEFWRRWHISLGTWFRDYLYFPLGGSRVKSRLRLVFNLFVVWAFTGAWHGANYTFIIWGLIYFALITFEKLINIDNLLKNKAFAVFYRLFTLFAVLMSWVLFRAENIEKTSLYFQKLFGMAQLVDDNFIFFLKDNKYLLIAAILSATPLIKLLSNKLQNNAKLANLSSIITAIIYFALFIICTSLLVIGTHNPFIYFNF